MGVARKIEEEQRLKVYDEVLRLKTQLKLKLKPRVTPEDLKDRAKSQHITSGDLNKQIQDRMALLKKEGKAEKDIIDEWCCMAIAPQYYFIRKDLYNEIGLKFLSSLDRSFDIPQNLKASFPYSDSISCNVEEALHWLTLPRAIENPSSRFLSSQITKDNLFSVYDHSIMREHKSDEALSVRHREYRKSIREHSLFNVKDSSYHHLIIFKVGSVYSCRPVIYSPTEEGLIKLVEYNVEVTETLDHITEHFNQLAIHHTQFFIERLMQESSERFSEIMLQRLRPDVALIITAHLNTSLRLTTEELKTVTATTTTSGSLGGASSSPPFETKTTHSVSELLSSTMGAHTSKTDTAPHTADLETKAESKAESKAMLEADERKEVAGKEYAKALLELSASDKDPFFNGEMLKVVRKLETLEVERNQCIERITALETKDLKLSSTQEGLKKARHKLTQILKDIRLSLEYKQDLEEKILPLHERVDVTRDKFESAFGFNTYIPGPARPMRSQPPRYFIFSTGDIEKSNRRAKLKETALLEAQARRSASSPH